MNSEKSQDYCRQKAAECLAKATAAVSEQERAQWLDLALLWLGSPDEIKSEN